MDLIFINNGKSSVFDSQVLALLNYYRNNFNFKKIILLFGFKRKEEIAWLKMKKLNHIEVVFFKSFPNYPFFNIFIRISLYLAIRKLDLDISNCYFHLRGEIISYHFKKIISILNIRIDQILTDLRGASIEEVKEFSSLRGVIKALKLYNYQNAYKNLSSDHSISVVSNALKDYFYYNYGIDNNKIYINSCLVNFNFKYDEEDRKIIRRKLKVGNEEILIVFSSGGNAKWQNKKKIFEFADRGFRVLLLSNDIINHPNVIVKFVPYEEVAKYLSAADLGFIWRDNSIVNKVASPVKFSEYIACGLGVIHNGTVDLIKKFTKKYSCGMEIQDVSEVKIENVNSFIRSINRKKLSTLGLISFGLERTAHSYRKIYLSNRNIY